MNVVNYKVENRIAFISLNRPEKRNALSYELIAELKDALRTAQKDETVKVVVLKANGEAFCAGADLSYLQQLQNFSYDENLADSNHLKELFQLIYTLSKVVIAQVEGHALAGGCGLATVCDFSYAVPEAKFGYTEVKIGFIPAIVMIFLIRKIGEAKAKQLLLTGDLISAQEAEKFGLINAVVPKEKIEAEVLTLAERLIKTNSSQSMMITKQMIGAINTKPLEEALAYASEMNAKARASDDCKRGVSAFLNKEKIMW